MVDPYVTAAQKRIQSRERIAGMSPQQLEQMRAQGIQQVQQDFGRTSQGIFDFARYLRQNPDKVAEVVARAGTYATPLSGTAESMGLAPELAPGSGYAPGMVENLKEGRIGDFLAQTAGVGLDVAQLSGIGAIPATAGKFGLGLLRGGARLVDDFGQEFDPKATTILASPDTPGIAGGYSGLKRIEDEAQTRLEAGDDPRKVFEETGFMRINVDPRVDRGPADEAIQTKMVFDIPDNLSQISLANAVPEEVLKKSADRKSAKEIFKAFRKNDAAYEIETDYARGKYGQSVRLNLDQVISPEHPIFDVFPDLAEDLDVRIIEKPAGNTGGHYNPTTNTIAIGAKFIGNDDYVSTLMIHELAHMMQTKGGLPGGGMPFNAPKRVFNNLYDNFALAESFKFIEGDMNLNEFIFSGTRQKDEADKLASLIYRAQTNVMAKNPDAPVVSSGLFPGDPYSSVDQNVDELPFRDEVRAEYIKLLDAKVAKANKDAEAFEDVGIRVMGDDDTARNNYMRLRGEFMSRLQEAYALATEGLSPQERRKLFPMDLATKEDFYPTAAARQKGVVSVPVGMQKDIQEGQGSLKRAIVLDRGDLATKYPSEQGLIDVVPAEGMDDPTGGLINRDAFTPEMQRQLRFKGSEAQSAGFIADSDKIRDTIGLIDPNKKMFEQPRAVRELSELPSVKSFLDFHTGADGIRQFDTTFRGNYLLDVLKREGFEPRATPLKNELSDLSTPELITSWVVEPAKVNRAEVAGRLASDPSAVARTNARLTDLGYGETVPMFRLVGIDDQGNFKPEGLISATLDPKKVPSNINFFTEGKIDMFNPAKHVLVRYDVPREKIAAYLPAVSEDINRNVNKAVKEKGFGQKKLKGLKTVTNPAVHAKNLINAQDEIFADVSGLKPNFLLDNEGQPMNMNSIAALIPKSVAEGDFETPEDIQKLFGTNNFVLDFRDFTDSDAFEEAEAQARQNLVDEYKKFFKAKKFADGGLVSLAPIARNMFRGPRALESLAPVARNMDRSMLRSG